MGCHFTLLDGGERVEIGRGELRRGELRGELRRGELRELRRVELRGELKRKGELRRLDGEESVPIPVC